MPDDFRQSGGSPWGKPPGGGGSGNGSGRGPTPPDIDKIIREIQEKLKKFLPGGSSSGGKQAILVLIILGFVWLASGLYRVCLLYTSPSPRDRQKSRMPSSA